MGEPTSLDPAQISGGSGNYLFHNLYRSLFRYQKNGGLTPEGVTHCERQGYVRLTCFLRPNMKWSDGSSVTAHQYLHAFRHLMNPELKTTQMELLMSLRNARSILSGQLKPHDLGVRALDDLTLQFEFSEPDFEFEYRLASPATAPLFSEQFPPRQEADRLIVNGPYQITSWKSSGSIRLSPNPYYPNPEGRPEVEILFVDDDTTALRLYETGFLNLLRRVPTTLLSKYRQRSDFFQLPLSRFDYLGFGPELKDQPNLRRALTLSLDYDGLKRLFSALGRPGCPSFPENYRETSSCYPFDPNRAKKILQSTRIPSEIVSNARISFSTMGGDDMRKGMEWVQAQWSDNLNLHFSIEGKEQGVYMNELRVRPSTVFRKGVSLDRPTCLAALEVFGSDNPENYLKYSNIKFDNILGTMRKTKPSPKMRQLCQKGLDLLLSENIMIPLGEIHFSMLQDGQFIGWELNELNQLDLTNLKVAKTQNGPK
ncbi:MAG: peptide ABC transporter substrate-binding protein [Bdellovibrionales bacterium]|nr:peptide ABC transporter substrate-binding protein [Bdellovibrionales bacterium]